jgi:hypothetical protein
MLVQEPEPEPELELEPLVGFTFHGIKKTICDKKEIQVAKYW